MIINKIIMTDKEMQKLTEMIVEAIDVRQRELDQEFYENANSTNNVPTEYVIQLDQEKSEEERMVDRINELYISLQNAIDNERFELAEDIRKTIASIKELINNKNKKL
tara:strand:- start:288 stop:611 length:324 start_codon:yes stop_codon:yes gene_type:complete